MGHDTMASPKKAKAAVALGANQIGIDNFSFTPKTLTVKAGTSVTWINSDDVPHLLASVQHNFPAPKSSTLTSGFRTRSASLARTTTFARFTRR